jgi:2-polyprenyl-3-methyl-5-hydroxy-6-metoxy-1,4-benzoquinol methylase
MIPGREALWEEACSLQGRSATPEKTPDFVIADDADQWLYVNRAERMDALDTSGIFSRDRQAFHRSRYEFAPDYVKGLAVADIACGLGYGCRILKEGGAKTVVGIDVCPEALQYAGSNHQPDGVCFVAGNATQIPLAASSVDVIISFETIEHVPNTAALLAEFHRILRPEGRLIISSPNDWGLTEHHCHTWTAFEFMAEVADRFTIESAWEQNSDSIPNSGERFAEIRPWKTDTAYLAECLIIVAQKPTMKPLHQLI